MKSTRCVSLKFKTTILIFIFKSTNQVFPQVVCHLATFFINNLHWSLSLSRHAGRAYLFLKLTVWTCVFHHTPTLGSISHMFQQPMKVASIIGFYILTSLNQTQNDWFLNSEQQISDQLGTGTQPASHKVRIYPFQILHILISRGSIIFFWKCPVPLKIKNANSFQCFWVRGNHAGKKLDKKNADGWLKRAPIFHQFVCHV